MASPMSRSRAMGAVSPRYRKGDRVLRSRRRSLTVLLSVSFVIVVTVIAVVNTGSNDPVIASPGGLRCSQPAEMIQALSAVTSATEFTPHETPGDALAAFVDAADLPLAVTSFDELSTSGDAASLVVFEDGDPRAYAHAQRRDGGSWVVTSFAACAGTLARAGSVSG